jgi:hypothetical protein
VWTSDGRRLLDFASGIGVTSFGHCHPTVVEGGAERWQGCAWCVRACIIIDDILILLCMHVCVCVYYYCRIVCVVDFTITSDACNNVDVVRVRARLCR